MSTCCVEGCCEEGVFRTRTKPTWCKAHILDVYIKGGLQLIVEFTNPNDYLLTRCVNCGFEGHYRFKYVLEKVQICEAVCRACFWRSWAVEQRDSLGYSDDDSIVSLSDVKRVAAANGYTYVRALTCPSMAWDPHETRCNTCGRIEALRPSDMCGCSCQRNTKSRSGVDNNGKRVRLFKELESPVVEWWDHERNDEKLWNTARPRGRQEVWWVCPEGHRFKLQIAEMTVTAPRCPACRERSENERRKRREALRGLSIAQVPELLQAWDDQMPPESVLVISEGYRERYHFRCSNGHARTCEPFDILSIECPSCLGLETKRKRNEEAEKNPEGFRLSPEIASQWDHERNLPLKLAAISPDSKRLVWWRDPVCGHEFQAVVSDRDKYQRYRCPECQTILDSFAFSYPDLARQWDPSNGVSPWKIRPTSSRLPEAPWWICTNNPEHRWQAPIASRIGGAGCPECRVSGKSEIERQYFEAAKTRWLNVHSGQHINRDSSTGRSWWEADILIEVGGQKLIVEYDGSYWHRDKHMTDLQKTNDFLKLGFFVCRIREFPLESLQIQNSRYLEIVTYPSFQEPVKDIEKIARWLSKYGSDS